MQHKGYNGIIMQYRNMDRMVVSPPACGIGYAAVITIKKANSAFIWFNNYDYVNDSSIGY
jgi:hypothetical protein